MAKTINWPKEFHDEIISEDMESPRIALRLGSLYYENGYYADKEMVDIRIDHVIARKAVILGDMKLLKIKDLSETDMTKYKKSMSNKKDLMDFLSKNYNQQVNEDTQVTVITYKNLDIVPFEEDYTHT